MAQQQLRRQQRSIPEMTILKAKREYIEKTVYHSTQKYHTHTQHIRNNLLNSLYLGSRIGLSSDFLLLYFLLLAVVFVDASPLLMRQV